MAQESKIHVMVGLRLQALARYRENLSPDPQFALNFLPSLEKLQQALEDPTKRADVLVVDNGLGDMFSYIREVRNKYPRLLIVLVDEEADFAMPGHADEVSTNPFENHELSKIIKRLFEDRRLETLRADSLPSVRNFAKAILKSKGPAKLQAAVGAIQEMGYDYVVYYSVTPTDPPTILQAAHVGPPAVLSIAPSRLDYENNIIGWVNRTGQSCIVNKDSAPNHPFVAKGRFGSGAGVPVGTTLQFGVVFVCREQPNAILQEDVVMLELVSAQLASALARESR